MLSLVVMGTDEANGVLFNSQEKKKKLRLGEVKTLTKVMELGCGRLVGSQEEL